MTHKRLRIQANPLALVSPAPTLNYLGQGAMVLSHPETVSNPFVQMALHWGRIPLVIPGPTTGESFVPRWVRLP